MIQGRGVGRRLVNEENGVALLLAHILVNPFFLSKPFTQSMKMYDVIDDLYTTDRVSFLKFLKHRGFSDLLITISSSPAFRASKPSFSPSVYDWAACGRTHPALVHVEDVACLMGLHQLRDLLLPVGTRTHIDSRAFTATHRAMNVVANLDTHQPTAGCLEVAVADGRYEGRGLLLQRRARYWQVSRAQCLEQHLRREVNLLQRTRTTNTLHIVASVLLS